MGCMSPYLKQSVEENSQYFWVFLDFSKTVKVSESFELLNIFLMLLLHQRLTF